MFNYPKLRSIATEKYHNLPEKVCEITNKLYRRQIRETERSVQLKKLEVEAKFGELKLQINNHLPKLVKIHDHYREVKLIFRNFGKEEIPVRLDERDMSECHCTFCYAREY